MAHPLDLSYLGVATVWMNDLGKLRLFHRVRLQVLTGHQVRSRP